MLCVMKRKIKLKYHYGQFYSLFEPDNAGYADLESIGKVIMAILWWNIPFYYNLHFFSYCCRLVQQPVIRECQSQRLTLFIIIIWFMPQKMATYIR